jgi:uncharacterized protein YdaU (DUF1376 family)
MSNVNIWMPIYINEHIANTHTLTTTEYGAYCRLVVECWKRGGVLPADENQLIKITGLKGKHAKEIIQNVLSNPCLSFLKVGNEIHNREISKQVAEAQARQEKLSNRGKLGANAKWSKDATSINQAMLKNGSSSSSTSINTKKVLSKDNTKESSPNGSPVVVKASDPDVDVASLEQLQAKLTAKRAPTPKFNPRDLPLHESLAGCEKAWAAWCDHRDEIKKPITPTAARQLLAKGQQMGATRFKSAIRHSAANGWQGLFEPPADTANGKQPFQQKTKGQLQDDFIREQMRLALLEEAASNEVLDVTPTH